MRELVGRSLDPLVRRFFVPILHSSLRRGGVRGPLAALVFIFSLPLSQMYIFTVERHGSG